MRCAFVTAVSSILVRKSSLHKTLALWTPRRISRFLIVLSSLPPLEICIVSSTVVLVPHSFCRYVCAGLHSPPFLFTCFTIQHSSVFPRTFSSIAPLVLGGMDRISSVEGLNNTVLSLSAFPDYIPYSSTHDISWYQRRLGVERSWRREYAIHPSPTNIIFPFHLIV